jgi:C1A family cysteine protease
LERALSRLFIYFNARVIERDVAHDDGITIRDGVHALRRHGACREETWPYLAKRVADRPSVHAFEEALGHRVADAERVHIDRDAIRACIAAKNPVVFGVQLFESFGGGGNHGRIAMPRPHEEKHIGGHTMVAVGYDDGDRVFIVRNSWGRAWGEAGYCFLPYDYVADQKFNDEAWTLVPRTNGAA